MKPPMMMIDASAMRPSSPGSMLSVDRVEKIRHGVPTFKIS